MAAIVDIVSGRCLSTVMHHRKQPNKSKLDLYKALIHIINHLKYVIAHT